MLQKMWKLQQIFLPIAMIPIAKRKLNKYFMGNVLK